MWFRVMTYAAVALKISFVLAEAMMLREKENTAVKAATAPSRQGILCIAYKTAIPPMGSSEATMVASTFRTRKVSWFR
jgi:hypothetical protein